MKFSKVFKIFKKGAKAASKHKGKKGAEPVRWPSGKRIGVFGHTNSGKTVYFTVLNEECKISKNLQISVTDTATAGEFLKHYRNIWGLGTASEAGTVVDFRGERLFPNPTKGDKILKFNATVDRKKKLSIVTYEYDGKAASISPEDPDLADKVFDFMSVCDGILFFYDPKLLGAEVESQARVSAFVNLMENMIPLRSRLPIPVAMVVTKADILPGFKGDEHVTLIGPEDEYLTSEDFELFLEKVLASPRISSNPQWAGSVRNVLVKMKDFLRVVLRRTLDFQVFFISNTGREPEKIGTDVGRSIYKPPAKMQPVGVKEPFYWLLNAIIRNKRISIIRKAAKYIAVASILWIVLFSIPYLIHFKMLLPEPAKVESTVAEMHGGSLLDATGKERDQITKAYEKYGRSAITRWFFDDFRRPAMTIADSYREDSYKTALRDLNDNIGRFAAIVSDQSMWPQVKPSDTSIIPNPEHDKLVGVFEKYHQTDSSSQLFIKSGRALDYWRLFVDGVKRKDDSAIWATIQNQVVQDSTLYSDEMSKEERNLGSALLAVKVKKERKKEVQQATYQLDDLIATINGNPSAEYRLKTAVETLNEIKSKVDGANLAKINQYIREARQWSTSREYTYTIESVPADFHLHIAVAEKGKDPVWKTGHMVGLFPGQEEKLTWKSGDVIYISIDSTHASGNDETWGKNPLAKEILRGDFSLFDMEGDIMFNDIGKKVSIRFNPGLKDRLPVLK